MRVWPGVRDSVLGVEDTVVGRCRLNLYNPHRKRMDLSA